MSLVSKAREWYSRNIGLIIWTILVAYLAFQRGELAGGKERHWNLHVDEFSDGFADELEESDLHRTIYSRAWKEGFEAGSQSLKDQ